MTSSPTTRLARTRPGTRVVVRHLIEGGERATDVLGELVSLDAEAVTVTRKGEEIRIPLRDVVVAKEVSAAPVGRGWRVASFMRRAAVGVFDLDGVLRGFNASGWQGAHEETFGLGAGGLAEVAFSLQEGSDMVIGRSTHAAWMRALETHLTGQGHAPERVAAAVSEWKADHGTPIEPTVTLVDELRGRGTPVFVFTNGTDRVPEELASIGLERLVPHLLNSHDLGFAKPAPEAYAVAHAEIERRLARRVGTAEVHFTDDRPGNVDAARVFGWQARVFTPPPGTPRLNG